MNWTRIGTYVLGVVLVLIVLYLVWPYLSPGPAAAATLDSSVTGPIFDLVSTALAAVVGYIVWLVKGWLNSKTVLTQTEIDDHLADRINEMAHRGIAYAKTIAAEKFGKIDIPVDNWFLNMAAEYAMRSIPDTVKKYNIGEDRMIEIIKARLPEYGFGMTSDVKVSTPAPDAVNKTVTIKASAPSPKVGAAVPSSTTSPVSTKPGA